MKTLLLLLALFAFTFSQAQTNVGGHITTNTVWNSSGNPYIVNDDITVDENVTLTIKPGVTLKFVKNSLRFDVLIFGTLRAVGTEDSMITFTSNEFNPSGGDWGGISFDDHAIDYDFSSQTGCILQYCDFHCNSETMLMPPHFISMHFSTAYIDHCVFNESFSQIYVKAYTELRITNNKFLKGASDGNSVILVDPGVPTVDISCNLFYDNRGQLVALNGDENNFHNNLVINCSEKPSFRLPTVNDKFYSNTIVDNEDIDRPIGILGSADHNTITRNSFGSLLSPGYVILIDDSSAQVVHNNIYNQKPPSLGTYFFLGTSVQRQSYSTTPIEATNNWFNMYSIPDLNSYVDDYFDDTDVYEINYQPFLLSPDIDAPITPPTGVNKIDLGGGSVKVTWNANPDADVAGYKIYWGNPTGYSFTNSIDVGNVLSYTLTGFNFADTAAVTAYDADADGSHDQCDGNESWFTYDYMFTGIPEIATTLRNYLCYPNPADEFTALDISVPGNQNGKVVITSTMGESIKSIQLKSLQQPIILVSDLACGIYTVSIYRGEERIGLSKLVIVR